MTDPVSVLRREVDVCIQTHITTLNSAKLLAFLGEPVHQRKIICTYLAVNLVRRSPVSGSVEPGELTRSIHSRI